MSRKVLLVYDDFAEMSRTQAALMKVGFDVVGIVKESLLADQLLAFNPDLVITAGKGGKVQAPSVAQKIRENSRFLGKVLLLLPSTQRPSAAELARIRMDLLAEFPVSVERLLHLIAKLLEIDAQTLVEKYRRDRPQEAAHERAAVTLESRLLKYEHFLGKQSLDVTKTSFEKGHVKDIQENLKKQWDFEQLSKIDKLKQKFVKALFRKSKSD